MENAMNKPPGFTADAPLYKTSGHNHILPAWAGASGAPVFSFGHFSADRLRRNAGVTNRLY
jgi:hypothetical protein